MTHQPPLSRHGGRRPAIHAFAARSKEIVDADPGLRRGRLCVGMTGWAAPMRYCFRGLVYPVRDRVWLKRPDKRRPTCTPRQILASQGYMTRGPTAGSGASRSRREQYTAFRRLPPWPILTA